MNDEEKQVIRMLYLTLEEVERLANISGDEVTRLITRDALSEMNSEYTRMVQESFGIAMTDKRRKGDAGH